MTARETDFGSFQKSEMENAMPSSPKFFLLYGGLDPSKVLPDVTVVPVQPTEIPIKEIIHLGAP